MLALTDPIAQGTDRAASPCARFRPAISIGSPRDVPVPCASTYEIDSAGTALPAMTSAMSRACAAGSGTVKPLDRPVWPTPVPLITAWTWSPSASARSSGLSTATPTPSPGM